jgi:cellobiose-specific phosphotransferase system component IIA
MIIKNFKIFESDKSDNNFPEIEEIKSYFYDFTDEVNTFIDDYEFGYIFFNNRYKSDYRENDCIDILKTDLSNNRLDYASELIKLNLKGRKIHQNLLKLIESGEESAYEYIFIHFDQHLFEKNKLDILIDCLKNFYTQTGFRVVKSLWSEDYVNDSGDVVTRYGFEGTFVRVSDEEYKKLCEIFQQGDFTPIITKLFQ